MFNTIRQSFRGLLRDTKFLQRSQKAAFAPLSFEKRVGGGLLFTGFLVLAKLPSLVDTPVPHYHPYSTDTNDLKAEQQPRLKEDKDQVIKMAKPEISAALKKSKAETVWGLFVSDSVSMPVHWYYSPDDIKKDFGHWLTGYEAPKDRHPTSILKISAVDGSGRGTASSKSSLIGNVILHDKLKYWNGSSRANHYHQGMQPGDNTLNAVMAFHELCRMTEFDADLVKPEREVRGAVLEEYVQFMTTPGSHNDTYAESFHRLFFKDWIQEGKPTLADDILTFTENRHKKMIAGPSDSQIPHIGSFVPAIPWIVRNAHKSEDECARHVTDFIKLTHPATSLVPFVDVYARLLHSVMNGKDLRSEILRVMSNANVGGPAFRDSILSVMDKAESLPQGSEERLRFYQSMIGRLGSACYIEGAFSSLLFLALEFHDNFEGGVLANANCGGENCHRGAALGAMLAAGAANRGQEVPAKWKDGLGVLKSDIVKVIKDMNGDV